MSEQYDLDIIAQAYDWKERQIEGDNDRSGIHAWCLSKESEPILVRFPEFPVFAYVELPLYANNRPIKWSRDKANDLYNKIKFVLGEDDAPIGAKYEYKSKLYYFRAKMNEDGQNLTMEDKFPILKITFKTLSAQQHCFNILKKPFKLNILGTEYLLNLKMWETDIDIIRKMLTERDCQYCQWFIVKARLAQEYEKIASIEAEYIADWNTLTPIPNEETKTWLTYPVVLVFDIETYSHNHKSFPNKYDVRHVAFMLSMVFQKVGKKDTRICYKIVVGDCHQIEGVHVIRVNNEIDMIKMFCELINKHNPQIITGYNIYGFDYPYLNARLQWRGMEWPRCGLLFGEDTKYTHFSWESGGYGINQINYLNMAGRITFDLYSIVKRLYKTKLAKFDLSTVGITFVGQGKHDVSAPEMFRTYENNQQSIKVLNFCTERYEFLNKQREFNPPYSQLEEVDSNELLSEISRYRQQQYSLSEEDFLANFRYIPYIWKDRYWTRPLFKKNFTDQCIAEVLIHYDKAKHRMTVVGKYCVQDSELVMNIFDKIKLWLASIETASIVGLPPMDLYIRGEQKRGLSQLYNKATRMGYILDRREMPYVDWSGGYVWPPVPGIYDKVLTFDFNSLYPNIIRRFNICYTTLVSPEYEHLIPDDLCNVFEFDDEIDLEKKKKKRKANQESEPSEEASESGSDDPEDFVENNAEDNQEEQPSNIKKVHYKFKFIKKEIKEGVLPQLVGEWIDARNHIRKVEMKKEKDEVVLGVLDQRQNALKISANSVFGGLGAQNGGKRPLVEGAMCITFKGRDLIQFCNRYVIEKYGAQIIYNDTDSTMFKLPDELAPNEDDAVKWGKKLEEEFATVFQKPLYLEFENVTEMLCLKKKKYIKWEWGKGGFKYKYQDKLDEKGKVIKNEQGENVKELVLDEDGNPEPDIKAKGMFLAQRSHCKWLMRLGERFLSKIMTRAPMQESIDLIFGAAMKLIRRDVEWKDLKSIRGLGAVYKQQNYFMKVFSDQCRKIGKPVEAGERLEYVVVNFEGEKPKELLGMKMRLTETFIERLGTAEEEHIDVVYYLSNILMKPIEQLWQICYNREINPKLDKYEQEDWYRAMQWLANNGLEAKVREAYSISGDNWKVAYDIIKSWKIDRCKTKVDKARTTNISGRDIFDLRLDLKPLKKFVKAYKRGIVREYVEACVSPSLFNKLYPSDVIIHDGLPRDPADNIVFIRELNIPLILTEKIIANETPINNDNKKVTLRISSSTTTPPPPSSLPHPIPSYSAPPFPFPLSLLPENKIKLNIKKI